MRYLWEHIEQILSQYDVGLPLHHFLRSYFKRHPKLGSRDRRGLSDAVYAWYRAGKAFSSEEQEAGKLRLAAMYLCGIQPKAFASFFPKESMAPTVQDRIRVLQQQHFTIRPEEIFPYNIPLSEGVTTHEWRVSMLLQPRLFLRIRKNKNSIRTIIEKADIAHEWLSDTCLALLNGTKVEALLPADSYVVQDASSQATGKYLPANADESWWDCCSGAGGKSLMLKDASPGVQLLATDVRQSILNNLKERFRLYHHILPEMSALDAADTDVTERLLGNRRFDGIICDVPCTGSGTWARTPERCYFFDPATVGDYAKRQKAILHNACSYLKENGRIIYITCSVFRAENEDVIEAAANEDSMQVVSSGLISGLSVGADALFAAELRRT